MFGDRLRACVLWCSLIASLDDRTFPGAAEKDDVYLCMTDWDGDGYGAKTPRTEDIAPGSDCDDSAAAANPGLTEIEGDGLDNNCDGV